MNKKIVLAVMVSVCNVMLFARTKETNEQRLESTYKDKNITAIIKNASSSKQAIQRIKQSGQSNLQQLQKDTVVNVLILMAFKFNEPVADIAKQMKNAKLSYNEQAVNNYIEMGTKLINAAVDNKPAEIKQLLKNGADVNFYGAVSGLPIGSARVVTPLLAAVVNNPGNVKLARILLDAKANVNFQRDFDKKSILYLAVEKNDKATDYSAIVALLLKYNADVNTQNAEGETPLDQAIRNNNIPDKIVQLLLEKGNANQKTKNKALINAVTQNRIEVVRMLLKHGAQQGTKNAEGKTVAQLAEGKPEIQALLQNNKK
ncbi:MAG TPA: ankyrin repeat domain-containing protein [Candidatus Dependentiae bacterium]|nr:ankyrin repeat domain-containing protein [Candidatus Dependentiae bacterium]HRQ62401.1 ankyrin repeat domain-containing protein [Candidatus Dependentiae bacterium]